MRGKRSIIEHPEDLPDDSGISIRRLVVRPSRLDISQSMRAFVLDRDNLMCQMCGFAAGDPHPDDNGRKTRLHVGRIIHKSMGGSDDPSNLRTICSVCNEGARNLILDRPSLQKLLIQIRRATGADQVEVLQWLVRKFPKQAGKILLKSTKK